MAMPSATERFHRAATSALVVAAAFALPAESRAQVSGEAHVFRSAARDPFTVMKPEKNVRAGQPAAMFRRSPKALPVSPMRAQWFAGARGYERFDVPAEDAAVPALAVGMTPGTPEYLGWSIALQPMEALCVFWSSRAG